MKKLFFVIPVYNVEKYLRRCVDSVIAQSYANTEIVLVDDGSPDGCPAICDGYEKKHDNIKVIHKENGGLSDARNAGLTYVCDNAAKDDCVAFVDSDDFLHPRFAERMISLMEEYSCSMAQCGYEKGENDAFSAAPAARRIYRADSGAALLGYDLKSQVFAKVFSARLFKTLRYPVGRINEDEFVTYRAVYEAKNVVFTDEKLFYYYQRGDSIMDNIAKRLKNNPRRYDYLKAYEERAAFFEKLNMPEHVMKTHEKACADIILRYCEQMYLKESDRDEDCVNGGYVREYRKHYALMIKRSGIPLKRRLMYMCFYAFPASAVAAGRIFTLRK